MHLSQEQSIFVENRFIINVMIATTTKILHHMKCKSKGKVGEVTLKIDINKVRDMVE